ncbi:unnamed protein product [Citrullus colocynthis]|uniref:Uncharacterized protein n=1 Tax=Citrullus colocynthis TaxID=252529 RepID=A0ABP0YTK3_9ROSI
MDYGVIWYTKDASHHCLGQDYFFLIKHTFITMSIQMLPVTLMTLMGVEREEGKLLHHHEVGQPQTLKLSHTTRAKIPHIDLYFGFFPNPYQKMEDLAAQLKLRGQFYLFYEPSKSPLQCQPKFVIQVWFFCVSKSSTIRAKFKSEATPFPLKLQLLLGLFPRDEADSNL